jgi:glutamate racemase
MSHPGVKKKKDERPASSPIGVFDSGPGGLAVLLMMQDHLPHEDVLYVGDTSRQPYELRSREDVCRITLEITAFLIAKGAKMVIVGCNTASAAGLNAARAAYPDVPILGMIGPGVRAALRDGKGDRFGLLGSIITVNSRAYETRLRAERPGATVIGEVPSDLFRYTEKGHLQDRQALRCLTERYCRPFAEADVETVILGCTDLTCVTDLIGDALGRGVVIIDPAEQVVLEAREILRRIDGLKDEGPPDYRFLITGHEVDSFAHYARSFVGLSDVCVRHIPPERLRGSGAELPNHRAASSA